MIVEEVRDVVHLEQTGYEFSKRDGRVKRARRTILHVAAVYGIHRFAALRIMAGVDGPTLFTRASVRGHDRRPLNRDHLKCIMLLRMCYLPVYGDPAIVLVVVLLDLVQVDLAAVRGLSKSVTSARRRERERERRILTKGVQAPT